jgi:hypothetical protein
LIQRGVQADSIVALSQFNEEFCNTIGPIADKVGALESELEPRLHPLILALPSATEAIELGHVTTGGPSSCPRAPEEPAVRMPVL